MTRTPLAVETPLDAALNYARLGWRVVPMYAVNEGACSCAAGPTCEHPGKHPRIRGWREKATTDERTIREWCASCPDCNLAVLTGAASGMGVLDVDPRNGGAESLAALEAKYGPLPQTVSQVTGGGGRHLFFKHPGVPVPTRTVAPGVEVKGERALVNVAPSRHASGRVYEWEPGQAPGEIPAAPLPAWLLALAQAGPNGDGTGPDETPEVGEVIPEGRRNATLTSFAGTMRRRGMGEDEIAAALLEVNRGRCRPPLPEEEVCRIAASVSRYEPGQEMEHLTDLGNARRLVARHGADLRHCRALGVWFSWDGRRWRRDETGEVMRRAKETIRALYAEAAAIPDEDACEALVKHALRSEAEPRIRAMVKLAETEPEVAVRASELDADPWALNVLNGTLDLHTGELRPHRREQLVTKLAPVVYDPEARSDLLDKLLERVLPNPRQRAFIQRAAGYSLTGDTGEEVLLFAHGPEATGKSTFLEALKATLGDYAVTADSETFLKRRGDAGIRNDVARLVGARVVVSVEVDEGKEFAGGLLKLLTGGDSVAARFLYREHFEYRPAFKLWIAGNHRPQASAYDGALWRRIVQIPFVVVIPEAERDPEVKRRLREDPEARMAILAWAVRGCREWQRHGLAVPDSVRAYTEEYRRENDPLAEWLDDACVLDPRATTAAGQVWDSYRLWAECNDEEPLKRRIWAKQMRARGLVPEKEGRAGVRVWRGLIVKPRTPGGVGL